MELDYNLMAAEYARHRKVQPAVYQNLLEEGGITNLSRVLEVGCGTGNYILALQAQTGCMAWGIDPSAEMLEKACARLGEVNFLTGKAEKLEFSARSFDLVFSVDVIHHVNNRAAFFSEAYRVLSKERRVCTVTDSENIIRRREPITVYFPETVAVELERYPRIRTLKDMMVETGFVQVNEIEVDFAYELLTIQAFRDKAYSSLYLIPVEAFERGIQHMEEDLLKGPIPCISRYLLLWGKKEG
jgi:SAM-dependent methyltransferase